FYGFHISLFVEFSHLYGYEIRQIIGCAIFGHHFIFIESGLLSEADAPLSVLFLKNADLCCSKVHSPLDFRLFFDNFILYFAQQLFAIWRWRLPCPAQARLIVPVYPPLQGRWAVLPTFHQ